MKTTKLAGFAGITWAVLNVAVGMSAGQPPAIGDPAKDIRAYLADNRSLVLASAFVFALTLPALLAFFGELVGRMRATSDTPGVLAGGAGAGLATFATGFGLAYLAPLPLALDSGLRDAAPDGLVTYLWATGFLVSMLGNIGFATVLLAVGASPAAAPHRSRIAATVIGAVTLAVSAVGLVDTGVTVFASLAFLVVAVWMVVVGAGMVRGERQARAGSLVSAGA